MISILAAASVGGCTSDPDASVAGNGGSGGTGGQPAGFWFPDASADVVPEAGDQDVAREAADHEDAAAGDSGCRTLAVYFADEDGDGFGRTDGARRACSPPAGAWVTVPGDCNDEDADVYPGQERYFAAAYSGPKHDSFDYDCSGSEDPDPDGPARVPECGALGVLDCKGSGYVATERSGDGVNPICGSARKAECQPALLVCAALEADADPVRCH